MGVYIGLIDDLNYLKDLSRKDRFIEIISNDYVNPKNLHRIALRNIIALPYVVLDGKVLGQEHLVGFSSKRDIRGAVEEVFSKKKRNDVSVILSEDKSLSNKKSTLDVLVNSDYLPIIKLSEKYIEDRVAMYGTRFDSFL